MAIETRLGLTNPMKRLAFHYLTKGIGHYKIKHPVYDEVEVSELYPWKQNPVNPDEYGAAIKVTFYRQNKKVRWFEFSIRFIGGGGNLAVFRVK